MDLNLEASRLARSSLSVMALSEMHGRQGGSPRGKLVSMNVLLLRSTAAGRGHRLPDFTTHIPQGL